MSKRAGLCGLPLCVVVSLAGWLPESATPGVAAEPAGPVKATPPREIDPYDDQARDDDYYRRAIGLPETAAGGKAEE